MSSKALKVTSWKRVKGEDTRGKVREREKVRNSFKEHTIRFTVHFTVALIRTVVEFFSGKHQLLSPLKSDLQLPFLPFAKHSLSLTCVVFNLLGCRLVSPCTLSALAPTQYVFGASNQKCFKR